ncbi:hypothetical protein Tco_1006592 [Tanacetum coccineum]|uniref:Uncharacterized protein n=1 Tax=Tanacetum coccineum TaxID=301880 RepID=A0ABQ5FIQ3_9ASTR
MGQPILGLWTHKSFLPFSWKLHDSDYTGSHGVRKINYRGCQISGQKVNFMAVLQKASIVDTSSLGRAIDGPRFAFLVVHIGMVESLFRDLRGGSYPVCLDHDWFLLSSTMILLVALSFCMMLRVLQLTVTRGSYALLHLSVDELCCISIGLVHACARRGITFTFLDSGGFISADYASNSTNGRPSSTPSDDHTSENLGLLGRVEKRFRGRHSISQLFGSYSLSLIWTEPIGHFASYSGKMSFLMRYYVWAGEGNTWTPPMLAMAAAGDAADEENAAAI